MNDFSPYEALQRAFRTWWLIAVLGILGGLLGWASIILLMPVYEATAVYVVRLDEVQLANDLKQEGIMPVDRDGVLKPTANLVLSNDVLNEVVDAAGQQSIELDIREAYRSFSLQRINTTWLLTVRHTDPQLAANLANLWAGIAVQAIQDAYQHADTAYNLELGYHAVSLCFSEYDFRAANHCAGTDFADMDELVAFQQSTMEQIKAENALARGLDHTLRFEFATPADVPFEPVRDQGGLLIAAGLGIGLVLGFLFTQVKFRGR